MENKAMMQLYSRHVVEKTSENLYSNNELCYNKNLNTTYANGRTGEMLYPFQLHSKGITRAITKGDEYPASKAVKFTYKCPFIDDVGSNCTLPAAVV